MHQRGLKLFRAGVWAGTLLLTVVTGCRKPERTGGPPPAVPVIASEVLVQDQLVYVENIGETLGAQEVEIRARVEGFLDSIHFKEGTVVESNALLYTIDPRPFEAAVRQAEGSLAQAQAQWEKAKLDTNRFGPLWERHAIPRQQYDDALAAEQTAAARVKSADAALNTATIQLGYTKIFAPLKGLIGKNEVSVGNLVGRGVNSLLTKISSMDPIHIRFSISEQDYLQFARRAKTHEELRSAAKGIFELILADGTVYPHKGDIVFADAQVDPTTGTLLLEVAFPNPSGLVRPGQFGRVRFPIEKITNAVLIPQRAVQELQANYYVFVVSPDQKAEFRKIERGPRISTWYVVRNGLAKGEKIVVEGVQKLQNNVPVAPVFTNLSMVPVAGLTSKP